MKWNKQRLVYIVITLGFLSQILLSKSLWYPANRQFFLVPMFDFMTLDFGNIGNIILFVGLLLSLVLALFYYKKNILLTAIVLFAILMLQDITRVQAWSYQYFLTFVILFIDWQKPRDSAFVALQYIMIFTYFWSGLQKLNPHYVEVVHPWLFGVYKWSEPFADIGNWAYASALFEALIGIGLMFKKSRKLSVIGGLGMHVFILAMIGPWGEDWNSVVYPWNIVMMALLLLLFWRKPEEKQPPSLFQLPQTSIQWLVFVLFGVLPAFNFFTKFPETISMTMYNGATSELSVFFDEPEAPDCIPDVTQKHIYPFAHGYYMSLDNWGGSELNVPIYDLPTYAEKFGKQFCDCIKHKEKAGIKITNVKRWTRENYIIEEQLNCLEILKSN